MANCKKCGAGIQVGETKCEYCGSVVELAKAQTHSPAGAEAARVQGEVPGSVSASELRFKRLSVGLMVLWAVLTLGLYCSIWFFVRRKQLAELSPKLKSMAHYFFAGMLGCHVFYVLGILGYLGNPDPEIIGAIQIFWYMTLGAIIFAAVLVRSGLAGLAASRGHKFADSTLWAIILNVLYLQTQINRMIDARILGEAS